MKKLFSLLSLVSLLLANGVQWQKDLRTTAQAAKESNKKVMILMSSEHCRYCKQMHQEVFSNPAIADYINQHFVSLELDVNNDAYPDALDVRGVPATFFFSSNLQTRYEKILGPRHPMMFMHILESIAKQP